MENRLSERQIVDKLYTNMYAKITNSKMCGDIEAATEDDAVEKIIKMEAEKTTKYFLKMSLDRMQTDNELMNVLVKKCNEDTTYIDSLSQLLVDDLRIRLELFTVDKEND